MEAVGTNVGVDRQVPGYSAEHAFFRPIGGKEWSWKPPPVTEAEGPIFLDEWDLSTKQGVLGRRNCVQKHIQAKLGMDKPSGYFVRGCDFSPLYDFDKWSEATGCGIEPIVGKLRYHVAWTGPYAHVREDLDGLVDSWLTTQDLARSRFTFWLIETDPDPTDPFQNKYKDLIEFKRAEMSGMAVGTALEGRSDFLELDWTTVKKGPRWRANLFRILILHKYGGLWVDTDSLFLRDLRPLVEFAGEFASKLTMSMYYNNNVMALQKGSSIGAEMINDVAATPFQEGERKYCKYVGSPCYPKWTWNHGLIQLAVRKNRGIVVFPTQFTDPAYACFPEWLLAKSGGMPMHKFAMEETMEFIRGAFVLHTRAYNADKPINPRSNYGMLYHRAKIEASKRKSDPSDLVPLPPRNLLTKSALLQKRGDTVDVVDPGFIPRGPLEFVLLKTDAGNCIDARRGVRGQTFGGFPELSATGDCAKAQKSKFNETVVFMWQSKWGYLRPAHREPGRVLCVDALPLNIYPPLARNNNWTSSPQMITCNPNRCVLEILQNITATVC
jgi:hypothetical protein